MKISRQSSRHLAAALACVAGVLVASLGTAGAADTTVPNAPASSVPAGDSGSTNGQQPEIVQSWALTPSGDGGTGGTRSELNYESSPGTVINDAVVLYNYSNVPMNFRVYATDAFNNADGQFDALTGDKPPKEVGTWVSIPQENVSLLPGKMVTIPITVTIPIDATPGDHAGAVLASNIADGTASTNDSGGTTQVAVDRRTGTRMYIQVAGALKPQLAVTKVSSTYHTSLNPLNGTTDVSFRVENRGNARLTGVPVVEVGGLFGIGTQTVKMNKLVELLPGQFVDLKTTVKGVPALGIATVTVSIKPESAQGRPMEGVSVATGSSTSFAPPVTLLLVLLAVFMVLLTMRAYQRRRDAALAAAPAAGTALEPEREHQPT